MKRILPFVLVLSLMVSMAVPAFAVDASTSFVNVMAGNNYLVLQGANLMPCVITCPSTSQFVIDSSNILSCSPASTLYCYCWDVAIPSSQLMEKLNTVNSNRYVTGSMFSLNLNEIKSANCAVKNKTSGAVVYSPPPLTDPGTATAGSEADSMDCAHLTNSPNAVTFLNNTGADVGIRIHGVHTSDQYVTYFFENSTPVGTNTGTFTSWNTNEYRKVTIPAGKQIVIINNGGYSDVFYPRSDTLLIGMYTLTPQQIMAVLSNNGSIDVTKWKTYDWGPNNDPLTGGAATPTDIPGFIAWIANSISSVFTTVTSFVTGMQSSVGNMATVFGNFLQLPAPIMGMIVTGMGIGILLRILGR
jgi:hypothetical protein